MTEMMPMARLAVEYWRLLRSFERTLQRLPEDQTAKARAQLRYSAGRLDALTEEAGLVLITFDGKLYEANLPAAAVNGEDLSGEGSLVVESTVEPAVVAGTRVLLIGKVMLAKGETENVPGD